VAVSSQATPEISVVIPLTDARGDAVEHLRTWTHEQTLTRSDFEVVIVSDGAEPAIDREVAALLQPHDRFEVAPGTSMIDLWNRAAGLATSNWLLFTENHVRAEDDCIEKALEGIRAHPDLDAASIDHGHLTPAPVGKLGARWFDEVYEEWFRPEQWQRLNLAGFVIRRDLHGEIGGHEGRYSLFAAPLLSARLAERRANVGHLPEARILHIQCDEIGEHHEHSADYVVGESEARTTLPPEFAERYFGYRPLVWNRRALDRASARRSSVMLFRELARALSRRSPDARWLARELAGRLPEALAGIGLRRHAAELSFRWSELLADSRWVPSERRYRTFLRAQDRVTRLAQLRWIELRDESTPPALDSGVHPIASVPEGAIVGVHGLEQHGGSRFRWSQPVVTMQAEIQRAGELRIDTGHLRGSPLAAVAAAYIGSRRLGQGELREEGADLVIAHPGGPRTLTILCRPMPAGPDEQRALGLPIFSVGLSEGSQPPGTAAAREPATVA